jgi:small subunit ribosomal protein S13
MVYIFETKINPKLTVVGGLAEVYGIGRNQSNRILAGLGIQKKASFDSISKNQLIRIRKLVEKDLLVSSRLRQEKVFNIRNLIKIRCYRGGRHRNRLPVRGQRTSTNAKTQKKKSISSKA